MNMQGEPKVEQPRGSVYAKKITCLFLGFIVLIIVPFYVYHATLQMHTIVTAPMSRVTFFGVPFDPIKLAHRLNPNGRLIYMKGVVAQANDSCSAAEPALPRGQMTAVTFTVGGTERHGVVYVPNSYPVHGSGSGVSNATFAPTTGAQPVPMLVLFHGLNDNCEHFLKATGFLPYAEKRGFVVVSACGSQGYLGTAWNSGVCCGFSGDIPDDVGFAREIVSSMKRAICVDERKVMAVGFSNGAMLAEVVACEAPEVFRAAASIGGVVELRPGNEEGLERCTAKVQAKPHHRASVLMVHGTLDAMVPWHGSKLLGFPAIETNLAAWAQRNDCDMDKTGSTINTPTYTNTIYDSCNASKASEVEVDEDFEVLAKVEVLSEAVNKGKNMKKLHRVFDDEDEDHADNEKIVDVHKEKKHQERDAEKGEEDTEKHIYNEKEKDKEGIYGAYHHLHHPKHGFHDHPHHVPRKPAHGPGPNRHRKGGEERPCPVVGPMKPAAETEATVYADSPVSQIELVKVKEGAHRWPEDNEFSTTDYIVQFGARVFGGYTF